MSAFQQYISQFGAISQEKFDAVISKSKIIHLKKEEFFSVAGKTARQVGFLTEGILRVYYFNDAGEEITKYFIDENNMVVDLASFDNDVSSTSFVQAITDCQITVFEKEDWHDLLKNIEGWDEIVRKLISRALLLKIERISPLVSEDATTRYLQFMEKYPTLINRIPLSYVASFLGVTQSSLSRIRKNIR